VKRMKGTAIFLICAKKLILHILFCGVVNKICDKNVPYLWMKFILILFIPFIFHKTCFHLAELNCVCVCARACGCVRVCARARVYLIKHFPQNDDLCTDHGQPFQSYSIQSTKIKVKKFCFCVKHMYVQDTVGFIFTALRIKNSMVLQNIF
jgi:hypothetical protein